MAAAKTSTAKIPELVPLTTFLKLKRMPRDMPLLFLTNAQWQKWERGLRKQGASAKTRGGSKARGKQTIPKLRLEATPMPEMKGFIVQFVGANSRLIPRPRRDGLKPGCFIVSIPLGRPINDCGRAFDVCEKEVVCIGECTHPHLPGSFEPACRPVWSTIPERRVIVGCRCW